MRREQVVVMGFDVLDDQAGAGWIDQENYVDQISYSIKDRALAGRGRFLVIRRPATPAVDIVRRYAEELCHLGALQLGDRFL